MPSPASIAFAPQLVGTLGPSTGLTFENVSSSAFMVTGLQLSGANADDFLVVGDGCTRLTLATGETCTVGVRHAPSAGGARAAALTAATDAGPTVAPDAVGLTGTGTVPPPPPPPPPPAAPPPPPPPAAAPEPVFRLVLAAVERRLSALSGKQVRFRYVSTLGADVVLEVRKGTRRIARIRGRARVGANTIRWNGKRGRKAAAPGRYRLLLTATNGGQRATTSAALTLRKPARRGR